MTLRIVDPGLYTLVVDLGRPSTRGLGVPVGGAADRWSLALGNALVGNLPESPALEITLAGPKLRASCALACVLYGAPFELAGNQRKLRSGTTFTLEPDHELCIGTAPVGMRAYLCVAGGIHAEPVLGSCSGLEPLKAGQELPCKPGRIHHRFLRVWQPWGRSNDVEPARLQVLDGPQADWFRQEEFYAQVFRVTPASNRMGLRLEGKPLTLPARELVSEPVCPGAVQVTRDGQCTILGVDGQTIGGYPKIAQVISADLDYLGQLRPGSALRFERVTLEEAETFARHRRAELAEWQARLQTAEVFV